MAVTFTGYKFKNCGFKLFFFQAQSNKVAKRMVRQRIRQDDGSFKANGEIPRKKGDLFIAGCVVLGQKKGHLRINNLR